MLGKAICSAAIAAADRRELASEWSGARPGSVRNRAETSDNREQRVPAERRQWAAERDQ